MLTLNVLKPSVNNMTAQVFLRAANTEPAADVRRATSST